MKEQPYIANIENKYPNKADYLTFQSLAVSSLTTRFNIKKFYTMRDLHWVFRTDIRTDSDFCLCVIN